MPKQRDYDYDDYDEDYEYGNEEGEAGGGEEEQETYDYVEAIRSQLAKGARVSDDAIVAQLEVYDYKVKEALKAIQSQLAPKKPSQAKGAPAPAKSSPSPASSGAKGAAAAQSRPQASSGPKTAGTASKGPGSVFAKAEREATAAAYTPSTAPAPMPHSIEETAALSDTESPLSGEEREGRAALTLVVVGHVDAGKSTLVGHLAHLLGQVSARTMGKFEKEARDIGKGSFAFAFVMDERREERERGVTIDIGERKIETERFSFTLLDSPGHRDYVPNMIRGAMQGDVALLVVPATQGEFEAATSPLSQTREHAVLLKALGVNQVVVCVNKMDGALPPWSAERFHFVQEQMRALLVQDLQFREQAVRCVPLSGLSGENLLGVSEGCALGGWYEGPSLLSAMNSFNAPVKAVNKPFRARAALCEEGGRRDGSKGVASVSVGVWQGRVGRGRTVGLAICSPHRVQIVSARVTSLKDEQSGEGKEVAVARDRVVVDLTFTNKGFELDLYGNEMLVLFKGPGLPKVAQQFTAQITTLQNPSLPPIIAGHVFELYIQGLEMQCKIGSLVSALDPKKKLKSLAGGKTAGVSIIVLNSYVLAEASNICKALGRFALRSKGFTVAVGTIEDMV